jgi:hypothetical protein
MILQPSRDREPLASLWGCFAQNSVKADDCGAMAAIRDRPLLGTTQVPSDFGLTPLEVERRTRYLQMRFDRSIYRELSLSFSFNITMTGRG